MNLYSAFSHWPGAYETPHGPAPNRQGQSATSPRARMYTTAAAAQAEAPNNPHALNMYAFAAAAAAGGGMPSRSPSDAHLVPPPPVIRQAATPFSPAAQAEGPTAVTPTVPAESITPATGGLKYIHK